MRYEPRELVTLTLHLRSKFVRYPPYTTMKTAAFITLGCKINQYETEAIREEVIDLGYREVDSTEAADVYVVNTCSVTATSGVKSRKYVQRAARTNPDARIIVVGCSTPSERRLLARIPQVAVLAGNEEKTLVGSYLDGGWKPGEPFPDKAKDIFSLNVSRYRGRTRANVKVQDGCNSFCSFCVIPFLRGRSRSRAADAVIEEVRRLVEHGFREVIITGVHLQNYGLDLEPRVALAELLERVGTITGLRRVRMSSIGVKTFDARLFDLIENPPFCPHWHVPLQSGSDGVLERMRRDYTVAEYRGVVEELERRVPGVSISTDMIVGHPGETERDFERTLSVCREVGFAKIHVFPYSRREGTLASKLGEEVEPLEIRRRARVLRELERELALDYKRRFVGQTVEVHVEGGAGEETRAETGEGRDIGPVWLDGFTERYMKVRFPAPSRPSETRFPGTFQPVKIDAAEPAALFGVWGGEVKA